MMIRTFCCLVAATLAFANVALGQQPPKTEDDLRREAAIAEFTRKMKEANYPALFDQAAKEFNVPADVLKGVAFAETRWEHLTWPPGETASPETGMPRPYGIMSLWDNQYFGHSLIEASKLLGKAPDELKNDPLQNMRGAAALLRKIYDDTQKPDGTTEADVESWRYAIRKYCGIPEPDLSSRHVLSIYTFMSQGYHQYGIEWEARPVNLEPIRQETSRVVAEENAKRAALSAAQSNGPSTSATDKPGLAPGNQAAPAVSGKPSPQFAVTPPIESARPSAPSSSKTGWIFLMALAAFIGALLFIQSRREARRIK